MASHSSEQNSFVERRFGSFFEATRAALTESELPQNYWSLAFLDAIEKSDFIPIKRLDGKFKAPNDILPCTKMNGRDFLPFGQQGQGYVVETRPLKKKLQERALKARYLRGTQ